MAVPYTFATATGSLPLSQLDSNFSTGIVIGNTTVTLGDTITTINNLTLANVTVTSASFSNVTLSGTTTVSGNTTVFSATGARIQGDFSNATLASRTAFQDKTTNNVSDVYILPNGTASTSGVYAWANSDPTNAAYVGVGMVSGSAQVVAAKAGSGTVPNLNIVVGSTTRVIVRTNGTFDFYNNSGTNTARLDASGNFSVIGNVTAYATL